MAEDLRLTLRALSHNTGRIYIEELLGVVFREFRIRKIAYAAARRFGPTINAVKIAL